MLLVGAAVVIVTLLLARKAVPWLLHLVARTGSRDVFILAVVLLCAGIAWITSAAGLSLALGAFLAGIVLADSEYGHQALADMLPLREIFTSLFFVSMGMLLDVRVVAESPGLVLALVGAVLLGKALLATVAGLFAGLPLQVALLGGMALSQIGEFSFVLAHVGRRAGLLAEDEMRVLFAASVVTMLVTPFALRFGPRVAASAGRLRALDRLLGGRRDEGTTIPAELSGHVVVLGYGVGGEMMAEVLRSAGVPFIVLDLNAERVREARRRGEPVYYGDVATGEMLRRARVSEARQVVVLLNDPSATLRAVRTARALAPDAGIIARARYVADVPILLQAGATEAVAQEFEASLEVIRRAMKGLALPEAATATPLTGRLPAGLGVESVPVHEGHWIAGRTLAEARLRARAGATLVAVSRGDDTAVHPSPTTPSRSGDVVCLVGSAAQIAAARALLAGGPGPDRGGDPSWIPLRCGPMMTPIGRALVPLLLAALPAAGQTVPALSESQRLIQLKPPTSRPVEMVLDTDTYNEIDDQFALVYALLSPELDVQAVYAAPFLNDRSPKRRRRHGEELRGDPAGPRQAGRLPRRLRLSRRREFIADPTAPESSPATRDLIARAMEHSPADPLYVVAVGAITNVASALLIEPSILPNVVVVWLGGNGHDWPDQREFNYQQDLHAARTIFDSGVPFVQLPCTPVVTHLATTVPEMKAHVDGQGAIGDYLFQIFVDYHEDHFAWSKVLWDMAAVAWVVNPELAPVGGGPQPDRHQRLHLQLRRPAPPHPDGVLPAPGPDLPGLLHQAEDADRTVGSHRFGRAPREHHCACSGLISRDRLIARLISAFIDQAHAPGAPSAPLDCSETGRQAV